MKTGTPVWQRVVCALIALGAAAAIVSELLNGEVSGLWGAVQLLLATCGAFAFAVIAIRGGKAYRPVESLPAPSAHVGQLVEAHQIINAMKAYRTEANATLFEAQSVMAHYWPKSPSKRPREKPRDA